MYPLHTLFFWLCICLSSAPLLLALSFLLGIAAELFVPLALLSAVSMAAVVLATIAATVLQNMGAVWLAKSTDTCKELAPGTFYATLGIVVYGFLSSCTVLFSCNLG
ncbi:hypothetical protein M427DRAFT_158809 [Gonapodya prolifera JEL478]|uniref:Uncharacterized protein n=1 Tax=Gonapodya prolifera (strain JEL478) TaxID=1344416 RepID=A0A139A222_GONPJ|nr:hypothetical protein M427DRAFT_158809 [Gonapodya prolifera JEL478]|eukprot:KXS10827.1 hypothetical protein M427DRAFT_158809 [Gonapodya prolifera JEL478]